ncbi:MAG: BolA family protein [Myxococcota bacterium]
MNRKQRIETTLAEALSPAHLDVVDESHRHSGGAGAESHYNVTVISSEFQQTLRVKRHRRVHELLADEFERGLHALTLTLLTPDEWRGRSEGIASPGCRGGSKAG